MLSTSIENHRQHGPMQSPLSALDGPLKGQLWPTASVSTISVLLGVPGIVELDMESVLRPKVMVKQPTDHCKAISMPYRCFADTADSRNGHSKHRSCTCSALQDTSEEEVVRSIAGLIRI